MTGTKPELLSPAGDWSGLKSAVENGADAVFFGVKGINMRHSARNFDRLEIPKVLSYLHENGRRGYLTLNTIVTDDDLETIAGILEIAKASDVDAVILWDMAVLSLCRERGIPVHISTQASLANIRAVEFYAGLGATRIVLARECDLGMIRGIIAEVKARGIGCEIETFIHGAMCVSISGRCFMSHEAFGLSANRGQCLQPCRREYVITDKNGEAEYVLGEDYVLSPKDLCTVDFIERLIEAGIASFKIEGRIRPPEYVAVVTRVYREAIDAYFDGALTGAMKTDFKERLSSVYNRGFSAGFYFGRPGTESLGHELEQTRQKVYLGEVRKFYRKIGVADIAIRNDVLNRGDEVLISGATTPAGFAVVDEIELERRPVDRAERGQFVGIKWPFAVRPRDKVFLWKKKT